MMDEVMEELESVLSEHFGGTPVNSQEVPWHAWCLVDSGFAHIKNRYRNHDCETLAQLTALVDQSSVTNTAVSYPTWTWRQWKPFLELYFKPVTGIMQYQYFRFDQSKPGIVTAKIQHDGEETELQILKNPTFRFQNVERPHPVPSAGLSADRR
ncbi:hypothetical protein DPMN_006557 [Dreissena polymorpha]|uniref:DUF7869 domain-containing protein n=1 Tax=Dreissena polymorpha TaxID=45954 RepID=A0A9D4RXH8_DREPO|nr:hypothetical protein DPMN_006557 [Dreissena polymorpha]